MLAASPLVLSEVFCASLSTTRGFSSIAREEMQGGTFTITNVGAIGGEYATPIVNHPEVAILALGAIKEKPRVHDGEVVPRHVMTVSLSFDHRVLDGAIAAQFTNRVEEFLEHPNRLLLE